MLSRLYEGEVTHHRRKPAHGFRYPVWYAWINLDEIDDFCQTSRWLSSERFNLLSFYRQDYLPGEQSLKATVEATIHSKTGRPFNGQVYLLTTLRQLGYAMNPISLYYCYEDESRQPNFILTEVHNTPWGERHVYLIEPGASDEQQKSFHVSPFMPMDLTYNFTLPAPSEVIEVGIQLKHQSNTVFTARLDLETRSLSAATIESLLLRHTWQSVRTITRIYFQALRLWVKRANRSC
ncbi:MAG: DUF1365 domain-containing protein [Proteobacteria bacterium]|nr:DUF1365 domain-containing protein [Pseudomonadota bacterium]